MGNLLCAMNSLSCFKIRFKLVFSPYTIWMLPAPVFETLNPTGVGNDSVDSGLLSRFVMGRLLLLLTLSMGAPILALALILCHLVSYDLGDGCRY